MSRVLSRWGGRYLDGEETESLLKEARIARVCCHNEDGTIHATPTWFKYENEKIIIPITSDSRKARNVKRNNNVTILVDIVNPPKGVMIYGTVELEYGDMYPMSLTICEKYLEKEKAKSFAKMMVSETGIDLMVTVIPERMITFHF